MKILPLLFLFALFLLNGCEKKRNSLRPVIENNTICASDGKLLRGTTLWHYRYGQLHHEEYYTLDPEYWLENKKYGLNCFRLVCFDPWQKKRGFVSTSFENEAQTEIFLSHLDSLVSLAKKLQMYLIINYHDVGNFDKQYHSKFWFVVAPRYAKEEFVLYELFNEPVEWFPADYSDDFLNYQEHIYSSVRKYAPETMLILFSFPNTSNKGKGRSMLDIVRLSKSIDWSNCVVGFHPYFTNYSSESISELKKNYPVFNTEQNIPSDGDVKPMDQQQWGVETMEELGIGWCAWSMNDVYNFKRNFVNGLLKDAEDKGYNWNN